MGVLMRVVFLVAAIVMVGGLSSTEVSDSRPPGINGETWQFGPHNR
ncbi:uncharacterized protein METZ01_LOCUS119331, partial [marine metagenome]